MVRHIVRQQRQLDALRPPDLLVLAVVPDLGHGRLYGVVLVGEDAVILVLGDIGGQGALAVVGQGHRDLVLVPVVQEAAVRALELHNVVAVGAVRQILGGVSDLVEDHLAVVVLGDGHGLQQLTVGPVQLEGELIVSRPVAAIQHLLRLELNLGLGLVGVDEVQRLGISAGHSHVKRAVAVVGNGDVQLVLNGVVSDAVLLVALSVSRDDLLHRVGVGLARVGQRVVNCGEAKCAIHRIGYGLEHNAISIQQHKLKLVCLQRLRTADQGLDALQVEGALGLVLVLEVEGKRIRIDRAAVHGHGHIQRTVAVVGDLRLNAVDLVGVGHAAQLLVRDNFLHRVGVGLARVGQRVLQLAEAEAAVRRVVHGFNLVPVLVLQDESELTFLQRAASQGLRALEVNVTVRLVGVHEVQIVEVVAVFNVQRAVAVVGHHHRHFVLGGVHGDAVAVRAGLIHSVHVLAQVVLRRVRRQVKLVHQLGIVDLAGGRVVRQRPGGCAVRHLEGEDVRVGHIAAHQGLVALEGDLAIGFVGVDEVQILAAVVAGDLGLHHAVGRRHAHGHRVLGGVNGDAVAVHCRLFHGVGVIAHIAQRVADGRVVDLARRRIARRTPGLGILALTLRDGEAEDVRRQHGAAFQLLRALEGHRGQALVSVREVQLVVVVGRLNLERAVAVVADLHHHHVLLGGYRDAIGVRAGLLHHIGVEADVVQGVIDLAELDLAVIAAAVLYRLDFHQHRLARAVLGGLVQGEVELVVRRQVAAVQALHALEAHVALGFIGVDDGPLSRVVYSLNLDGAIAVVGQGHRHRDLCRIVVNAAQTVFFVRDVLLDRVRQDRGHRQACGGVGVHVVQRVLDLVEDHRAVRRVGLGLAHALAGQREAELVRIQVAARQHLVDLGHELALGLVLVLEVEGELVRINRLIVLVRHGHFKRAVAIVGDAYLDGVDLVGVGHAAQSVRVLRLDLADRVGVGLVGQIVQVVGQRLEAEVAVLVVVNGFDLVAVLVLQDEAELAGLQPAASQGLCALEGHIALGLVGVGDNQAVCAVVGDFSGFQVLVAVSVGLLLHHDLDQLGLGVVGHTGDAALCLGDGEEVRASLGEGDRVEHTLVILGVLRHGHNGLVGHGHARVVVLGLQLELEAVVLVPGAANQFLGDLGIGLGDQPVVLDADLVLVLAVDLYSAAAGHGEFSEGVAHRDHAVFTLDLEDIVGAIGQLLVGHSACAAGDRDLLHRGLVGNVPAVGVHGEQRHVEVALSVGVRLAVLQHLLVDRQVAQQGVDEGQVVDAVRCHSQGAVAVVGHGHLDGARLGVVVDVLVSGIGHILGQGVFKRLALLAAQIVLRVMQAAQVDGAVRLVADNHLVNSGDDGAVADNDLRPQRGVAHGLQCEAVVVAFQRAADLFLGGLQRNLALGHVLVGKGDFGDGLVHRLADLVPDPLVGRADVQLGLVGRILLNGNGDAVLALIVDVAVLDDQAVRVGRHALGQDLFHREVVLADLGQVIGQSGEARGRADVRDGLLGVVVEIRQLEAELAVRQGMPGQGLLQLDGDLVLGLVLVDEAHRLDALGVRQGGAHIVQASLVRDLEVGPGDLQRAVVLVSHGHLGQVHAAVVGVALRNGGRQILADDVVVGLTHIIQAVPELGEGDAAVLVVLGGQVSLRPGLGLVLLHGRVVHRRHGEAEVARVEGEADCRLLRLELLLALRVVGVLELVHIVEDVDGVAALVGHIQLQGTVAVVIDFHLEVVFLSGVGNAILRVVGVNVLGDELLQDILVGLAHIVQVVHQRIEEEGAVRVVGDRIRILTGGNQISAIDQVQLELELASLQRLGAPSQDLEALHVQLALGIVVVLESEDQVVRVDQVAVRIGRGHIHLQRAVALVGDGHLDGVGLVGVGHAAQLLVRDDLFHRVLVGLARIGQRVLQLAEAELAVRVVGDGLDHVTVLIQQLEAELAFLQVAASQRLRAFEGHLALGVVGVGDGQGRRQLGAVGHGSGQLAVLLGHRDDDQLGLGVVGQAVPAFVGLFDGEEVHARLGEGDRGEHTLVILVDILHVRFGKIGHGHARVVLPGLQPELEAVVVGPLAALDLLGDLGVGLGVFLVVGEFGGRNLGAGVSGHHDGGVLAAQQVDAVVDLLVGQVLGHGVGAGRQLVDGHHAVGHVGVLAVDGRADGHAVHEGDGHGPGDRCVKINALHGEAVLAVQLALGVFLAVEEGGLLDIQAAHVAGVGVFNLHRVGGLQRVGLLAADRGGEACVAGLGHGVGGAKRDALQGHALAVLQPQLRHAVLNIHAAVVAGDGRVELQLEQEGLVLVGRQVGLDGLLDGQLGDIAGIDDLSLQGHALGDGAVNRAFVAYGVEVFVIASENLLHFVAHAHGQVADDDDLAVLQLQLNHAVLKLDVAIGAVDGVVVQGHHNLEFLGVVAQQGGNDLLADHQAAQHLCVGEGRGGVVHNAGLAGAGGHEVVLVGFFFHDLVADAVRQALDRPLLTALQGDVFNLGTVIQSDRLELALNAVSVGLRSAEFTGHGGVQRHREGELLVLVRREVAHRRLGDGQVSDLAPVGHSELTVFALNRVGFVERRQVVLGYCVVDGLVVVQYAVVVLGQAGPGHDPGVIIRELDLAPSLVLIRHVLAVRQQVHGRQELVLGRALGAVDRVVPGLGQADVDQFKFVDEFNLVAVRVSRHIDGAVPDVVQGYRDFPRLGVIGNAAVVAGLLDDVIGQLGINRVAVAVLVHVVQREGQLRERDCAVGLVVHCLDHVAVFFRQLELEGRHDLRLIAVQHVDLLRGQFDLALGLVGVHEVQIVEVGTGDYVQRAVAVVFHHHGHFVYGGVHGDAVAVCAGLLHGVHVRAQVVLLGIRRQVKLIHQLGIVDRARRRIVLQRPGRLAVGHLELEHVVQGTANQGLVALEGYAAFRLVGVGDGQRFFAIIINRVAQLAVIVSLHLDGDCVNRAVIGDTVQFVVVVRACRHNLLDVVGYAISASRFIEVDRVEGHGPVRDGGDAGVDGVAVRIGQREGKAVAFLPLAARQFLSHLQRHLGVAVFVGDGDGFRLADAQILHGKDASAVRLHREGHGLSFRVVGHAGRLGARLGLLDGEGIGTGCGDLGQDEGLDLVPLQGEARGIGGHAVHADLLRVALTLSQGHGEVLVTGVIAGHDLLHRDLDLNLAVGQHGQEDHGAVFVLEHLGLLALDPAINCSLSPNVGVAVAIGIHLLHAHSHS